MNFPTLVSCTDKLIFHNPEIVEPYKVVDPHKGATINCCTWGSNGKYVASGGDDSEIWLTSVVRMQPYIALKDNSVNPSTINSLDFSSNNFFLASGSGDGLVKIWDLKSKKVSVSFQGLNAGVTSVAWNLDSGYLAGGTILGNITVYDMNTNGERSIKLKQKEYDGVKKLAFSPKKRHILSTVSTNGFLRIWDVESSVPEELMISFQEHTKTCTDLSFSPVKENLMCTTGLDKKVLFYDLEKQKKIKSFETNAQLTSCCFHEDGSSLFIGNVLGQIYFIDLRNIGKSVLVGHNKVPVNSLSIAKRKCIMDVFGDQSNASSIRNTYSQSVTSSRNNYTTTEMTSLGTAGMAGTPAESKSQKKHYSGVLAQKKRSVGMVSGVSAGPPRTRENSDVSSMAAGGVGAREVGMERTRQGSKSVMSGMMLKRGPSASGNGDHDFETGSVTRNRSATNIEQMSQPRRSNLSDMDYKMKEKMKAFMRERDEASSKIEPSQAESRVKDPHSSFGATSDPSYVKSNFKSSITKVGPGANLGGQSGGGLNRGTNSGYILDPNTGLKQLSNNYITNVDNLNKAAKEALEPPRPVTNGANLKVVEPSSRFTSQVVPVSQATPNQGVVSHLEAANAASIGGGLEELIERKVRESQEEMKDFFHTQLQSYHLDMIRQFEMQKEFFQDTMMDYAEKYNKLQSDYDRLLLENEALKKSGF